MDDGRGKIKFTTRENTDKFYWKGCDASLDYPKAFIGTMTPSIFRWSDRKMLHLYKILDIAYDETKNTIPVICCGQDEYTAIEFLQAIKDSRMWIWP